MENAYCRFCAEPKTTEKLLNLDNDKSKYNEVLVKLAFLHAIYVDVSKGDNMPRTICFVCYDALNKAYEFLANVKKAQDVLADIFINKETLDERLAFDDIDFLDQEVDSPEVKQENLDSAHSHKDVADIKIEPTEVSDANLLHEEIDFDQSCVAPESYTQTLNVQDILDAALSKETFMPSVTYAKELKGVSKKVIKSWKQYPWICAYCNIEFIDMDMLRSHSKVAHGKCAAFSCIDCKWEVKKDDFNSFLRHVKKHRNCLRNQCHYCNEPIGDVKLKSHLKQHFLKSQVPCMACGEILENEEAKTQHVFEYFSIKPKRKPRRKAGTPLTIEDLTCLICKKVYKNTNSLRDHMKRHTSDRKRNYTCDRCGKTFYNKGTLTSHIMSHDQVRPHPCRICNKSFLFPNMLRRHVDMHSGVKPFACDQCGRRFRLQYQLNAHKIIHTDAMPYVCQYCNKAFRFKQILKGHERQHTGVKPYSCQHCGMEFSNWSNYNKHMKRRHGTDTSKKKITPEGIFPINPETGQIIQLQDQGTEEWKTKVMIPVKRGKKKVIKQEDAST